MKRRVHRSREEALLAAQRTAEADKRFDVKQSEPMESQRNPASTTFNTTVPKPETYAIQGIH